MFKRYIPNQIGHWQEMKLIKPKHGDFLSNLGCKCAVSSDLGYLSNILSFPLNICVDKRECDFENVVTVFH